MIRVGQRLQDERVRRGLTLDEVSKTLKIKYFFLSALEEGNYKELPSGTHAYGFVRNYAKLLGLAENEILALFKREYDEEKFHKVLPEGLVRKDFPIHRIRFGQTFKIVILIFLVFLGYIFFQYRYAIFNPPLDVSSPEENSIVSSQTILVIGKTDPNSSVFINDDIVSIDKEGNFKKSVNVFPGKARIVIKAVNKFKKETVIERNIEVKP
ncbi:MAG: helix-turn-helix domain-containing protein [Candidatus Levybacteria bacterium]|nr:helix-turn-helix domain-containing protein [Candidatus Levybacteria bacterium]